MMELVSIVAGIICGILAGVPTAILLLIWMSGIEAAQARQGERQSRILPPIVIVEQRLLEDGKRR